MIVRLVVDEHHIEVPGQVQKCIGETPKPYSHCLIFLQDFGAVYQIKR